MRVVVADDDLSARIMVQAVIEQLGHECFPAEDGEQAWQVLSDTHADVVITDLLMPVVDGLELCRRIRAQGGGSYTYVILVSSLGERDDVLCGMEAGADDYLTKPLEPFELRMRLVAAQRVTSLHAELARYRSELARQASIDPLTQLRNRLSLGEDLTALHAASQRYAHGYCLAMCDVDSFKAFNDTHGHQAGDEVLRVVSTVLAAEARQGDGVYRYGGEEFLLVLPEQSLSSAAVAAERARAAVESLMITCGDAAPTGPVTISIGVAAFRPDEPVTADDVLKRADAALYQAKAAGRNRVVLAARRN